MSERPKTTEAGALGEKIRGLRGLARHATRTLRMVAGVDRGLLYGLVACEIVDAVSLIVIAWVGKHLVDAIVAAIVTAPPRDAGPALFWVGIELAAVCARAVATHLHTYFETSLASKVDVHVNQLILEKAASVSYERFEDPEFVDAMTRARDEASYRPFSLVLQSLSLGRHFATLVGFGALLAPLGAWALLVLLVAAVPPFVAQALHGRATFALRRARTTRLRRAYYFREVMTDPATAKEVKLFGLARWLIDLFVGLRSSLRGDELKLASSRARTAVALALLSSLVLYATYGVVVLRAVSGAITLGSMTLYLLVLRQGQTTLQSALGAIARAYEDNLFMTNLYEYLAVPEDEPEGARAFDGGDEGPDRAAPRVEFRGVSFRYPGSERDALSDVNLELRPGETIALVGRNGAGKTTLVKLLVGFHRPTAGSIRIDGRDITELSAIELRRKIGVIFQDFARFQLSAADNVGVGWLSLREDHAALESAVRDAGAASVVGRLSDGLATPLGRAFGGDDLSVGEWQRIALARAFMRRSRILVLDEPTAAMDAEAEHEIFQRFRDLKANRTALLITHRLSTVRMADRIVVFDDGAIVEEGTHDSLIARDGQYAQLFRLQADAYAG